jgi:16S rRNA (adenine1518-N6/adenine1519-N6)-dimethyltransferase
VDYAIFTIQKEVAERYTAKINSKEYGITTLALQLYCVPKIIFHISAKAFYPAPKVRSSVLLLDMRNKNLYSDVDKKNLMELIRASFSQRRKVLSNALKQYFESKEVDVKQLKINLEKINKQYLSMRAEQLSIDDYILFHNLISD